MSTTPPTPTRHRRKPLADWRRWTDADLAAWKSENQRVGRWLLLVGVLYGGYIGWTVPYAELHPLIQSLTRSLLYIPSAMMGVELAPR